MRRHVIRAVFLLVLVAPLAAPVAAAAQDDTETALDGKLRSGETIEVGAEESVGDLYAAGNTVRVLGTVDGDLVAVGADIQIDGTVTGDVLGGANTVTIDGRVGGDVRLGAGQVTVDGTVGEDLLLAAGTLVIGPEARVGADVVFATAQTTIDGVVDGGALGRTSQYQVDGSIAGEERVTIEADDLERAPTVLDRVWSAVRRWISLVLVGALLVLFAPGALERARAAVVERPLPSAGIGVLAALGVPIALVASLFVVAVVAALLGLLGLGQLAVVFLSSGLAGLFAVLMAFVVLVVFVAQVVVSLAIGAFAVSHAGRAEQLGAIALGALVLVVLFAVPVLGGLLELATVAVGVGALLVSTWRARAAGRGEATDDVEPTAVATTGPPPTDERSTDHAPPPPDGR